MGRILEKGTVMLPDPHDNDWDVCLNAYCAARAATLRRLETIRARIDQVDARAGEAEKDGVDLTVAGPVRSELLDRVHLLDIMQMPERQYLVAFRHYIDLCRAVHGKVDRYRYDLITDLRRLGVPFHIATKMADDGVSIANET